MVKDVYYGKTLRKSYSKHPEILQMPNMLKIQKDSYQWFLDEGLRDFVKFISNVSLANILELATFNSVRSVFRFTRNVWGAQLTGF